MEGKVNPCVMLCGFTVMVECGEERAGSDLRQDCEEACADGNHDSIRSGAILGQKLVNQNGCEKYFKPAPVPANDTRRTLSNEEMVALAALAIGALILLSMMPLPVFI